MNITTILFDLDGTLLPMKQEEYAKAYIGGLVKSALPYGYYPQKMKDAIIEGTVAMVKNSGEETNEKVFWNVLLKIFGPSILENVQMFDEFYQTDFQGIRNICGFDSRSKEILSLAKSKGLRTVLATNPLFPLICNRKPHSLGRT